MNLLLQSSQPIVLFVVVFLAVLLVAWRLLSHSPGKPAQRFERSAQSGSDPSEAAPQPTAALYTPASASFAVSENPADAASGNPADPSGIIAEVCSLQYPAREDVERSYRGRRVRWTLCLSAISDREGQGSTHTVRMYPIGRSPFSCGVYFRAKAAECAVLQAAGQKDAFVVEGTIDKVEDRDIDLTDVQMIARAA